ncbi:methyltransferase domain-containing protein [Terrilactibacillus sp. BCM23-1]|uniref:Methyltransferase domain-containing protein n=1 Tax=Terrilactibacillus tamarindi TaxID=2599694 RepID=A0A6N8CQZ5_9BACI|nr:methyltransferase domain-containing protein [Terrilactibacillus tamarindi]MTT32584.1 methyltransferase domain-containing protein [Terrilactibacillus tamarindi]
MKSKDSLITQIKPILAIFDEEHIAYTIEGEASCILQDVEASITDPIAISVQWDFYSKVPYLFDQSKLQTIMKDDQKIILSYLHEDHPIHFIFYFNHVIVTDPFRLPIKTGKTTVWVRSLDAELRLLKKEDSLYRAIKHHFQKLQESNTVQNGGAWNQEAYQAWIKRFGSPDEMAHKLRTHPKRTLSHLLEYLGDLQGRKVINLLGSHGAKAIAMAILGASSTVVDISNENAKYAREVADAAEVPLNYIVSDVLSLPETEKNSMYDLVLMELGILHYFIDLEPLATLVYQLLDRSGKLILQDFHPISTKLITSKGKKHKVTGNYFDKQLEIREVAYTKHLTQSQDNKHYVYLRKWTIGEIVTAFAEAGLTITRLDESPNIKINDIGIPKVFTLVAQKKG